MLAFPLADILHVRQISGGIPDGVDSSDTSSGNLGGADSSSDTSSQSSNSTNSLSGGSSNNYTAAIVVAIVAVVFTVGIFAFIAFRRWQRTRAPKYTRSGRDDNDHTEAGPATTETRITGLAPTAAVDRTTSIRSVMTLPPYRPRALEGESVLGREGERDGIDVVVEMPTAEADENLREEEMDTLYQIRVARRRQQEERIRIRDARRDARARGDRATLETLRQQSRTATSNNPLELERLRSEHARAQELRQRAVTSVSYADLGVARHDGTRIRANSNESERMGLLSDAASIGASARSPSALSQTSPSGTDVLQRARSASTAQSITTTISDDLALVEHPQESVQSLTRSRASSLGRAGSSPELIDPAEADMGDDNLSLPPHSPPGYDEVSLNDLTPQQSRSESSFNEPPPDYSPASGPTEARNRRISAHVADLAAEAATADAIHSSSSSEASQSRPNSRVIPQLPSLRVASLPQIVIEPSSAVPRDS